MPQWYESLSNRGKERRRLVLSSSRRLSISGLLKCPERCCNIHSPSAPENVNVSKLHLTTAAVEGALALRAAHVKQEPFSVFHDRRQTSRSGRAGVGRRSNAAQWVQPGTARVYAHYHVTVTLRLNGFPPSFKNWHTVRAGLSVSVLFFFELHRCKRRKYSVLC